jgi:predicted site-specific integrase-resolvase
MKTKRTYSTKEVAREVGIHWVTLLRWISDGKVRPSLGMPMNGQTLWRWTDSDVERVRKFKTRFYWRKSKNKSGSH